MSTMNENEYGDMVDDEALGNPIYRDEVDQGEEDGVNYGVPRRRGRNAQDDSNDSGSQTSLDESEASDEGIKPLDPESAWYFIRMLVHLELEYEMNSLWRLDSLDLKTNERMGTRGDFEDEGSDARSGSSASRDSDDSDESDDSDVVDMRPRDVPILRYLIKHFLLTMPLVRDAAYSAQSLEGGTDFYWTGGLLPLLQVLHRVNLSSPEDRGIFSISARTLHTGLTKTLERFITCGLKLATAHPPWLEDDQDESVDDDEGTTVDDDEDEEDEGDTVLAGNEQPLQAPVPPTPPQQNPPPTSSKSLFPSSLPKLSIPFALPRSLSKKGASSGTPVASGGGGGAPLSAKLGFPSFGGGGSAGAGAGSAAAGGAGASASAFGAPSTGGVPSMGAGGYPASRAPPTAVPSSARIPPVSSEPQAYGQADPTVDDGEGETTLLTSDTDEATPGDLDQRQASGYTPEQTQSFSAVERSPDISADDSLQPNEALAVYNETHPQHEHTRDVAQQLREESGAPVQSPSGVTRRAVSGTTPYVGMPVPEQEPAGPPAPPAPPVPSSLGSLGSFFRLKRGPSAKPPPPIPAPSGRSTPSNYEGTPASRAAPLPRQPSGLFSSAVGRMRRSPSLKSHKSAASEYPDTSMVPSVPSEPSQIVSQQQAPRPPPALSAPPVDRGILSQLRANKKARPQLSSLSSIAASPSRPDAPSSGFHTDAIEEEVPSSRRVPLAEADPDPFVDAPSQTPVSPTSAAAAQHVAPSDAARALGVRPIPESTTDASLASLAAGDASRPVTGTPGTAQAADVTRATASTTQTDYDLNQMATNASFEPTSYAEMVAYGPAAEEAPPLPLHVLPKNGSPWPWGMPVPFWRGTPFHNLRRGGYEVDVVGVRAAFFSEKYIIRLKRPGMLDEFVLRDEKDFKAYLAALDADIPQAFFRRLPSVKAEEQAPPLSLITNTPDKQGNGGLNASPSRPNLRKASSSASFSENLAAAASSGPTTFASPAKPSNRNSILSLRRTASAQEDRPASALSNLFRPSSVLAREPLATDDLTLSQKQKLSQQPIKPPALDAQRRALRTWLRDTLSVRNVGHHRETKAFLLYQPVSLTKNDIQDMAVRNLVDEQRRTIRVSVAQGAAERAHADFSCYQAIQDDLVNRTGLATLSELLRTVPSTDKLPPKYQKALVWLRLRLAEVLSELLVTGTGSGRAYAKLRAFSEKVPWNKLSAVFSKSSPSFMLKAFQKLFFESDSKDASLLSKLLTIILEDDPYVLLNRIHALRRRIGSVHMCEKIERYVHAPRDVQELMKYHAKLNNVDLVVWILLRGSDSRPLDRFDRDRLILANREHVKFLKAAARRGQRVPQGRAHLILDLKAYMKFVTRERDASVIRQLLAHESVSASIGVVFQPIFDLLKRVSKAGAAKLLFSSIRNFIQDLVRVVSALRSRIQDPQRSVRIIARLLGNHQESFYAVLRTVHVRDTIIDEWLQWASTAAVFLRRGLARAIDVDALFPADPLLRDQIDLAIDNWVRYHEAKRMRMYQNACRRYAADVDGDDAVVVDGDGHGNSRVEPLIELPLKKPALSSFTYSLRIFRQQMKEVFAA